MQLCLNSNTNDSRRDCRKSSWSGDVFSTKNEIHKIIQNESYFCSASLLEKLLSGKNSLICVFNEMLEAVGH